MRTASPGFLSSGALLCRKAFGLRWQSAAATPLFGTARFQSGVALRFPPQSKIHWLRLDRMVVVVMGVVFSFSRLAVVADDDWKLPAEKTVLKAGFGRELVLGQCLLCHSADYIATQPPLTRAQWQATVDKMRVRYGAPIATNSAPVLLDYLTAAYGRTGVPK